MNDCWEERAKRLFTHVVLHLLAPVEVVVGGSDIPVVGHVVNEPVVALEH